MLLERIHHAAHLLPSQGPIGVFIHHNTLHAFEDQSFDDAVRSGATIFGCEPYLSEDRYRQELSVGRIQSTELKEVLERRLGGGASEKMPGLGTTRLELQLAMLLNPLQMGDPTTLDWFIAETDALSRARSDVSEIQRRHLITATRQWVMQRLQGSLPGIERPDWIVRILSERDAGRIEEWDSGRWEAFTLAALWQVCRHGTKNVPVARCTVRKPVRHRDALLGMTRLDADLLVHDVLIRFCSSFLDQGIAHWKLPGQDAGLFQSFCDLHQKGSLISADWMSGLGPELQRLRDDRVSPIVCIRESLDELGVSDEEEEDFLRATLLVLRGWGGMIWHVEQRADRVHHGIPQGSLVEFLAVRLLLDRFALRALLRKSGNGELPLSSLRDRAAQEPEVLADRAPERAFLIFQLAQLLGWTPEQLFLLGKEQWNQLAGEIESFDSLRRRSIFHEAYEQLFADRSLDALVSRAKQGVWDRARPAFQAVFCIDEREESIRRHLEETAPEVETFGAAGFFGVVMYYRGAAAADFVPLCPVVVKPGHWVSETVDLRLVEEDRKRKVHRRRIGMALQGFHRGSRRVVSGAFLSATLGLLATAPLVARVVFPRLTARLRGFFGRLIQPPPVTRLNLERLTSLPSPAEADHGFSADEMGQITERILRDIGMTRVFARLVFFHGHGSTSLNNPHESAHDCGACGGGVGGPNARAIAEMLNDARIRKTLASRGIVIPGDTVFIGGLHNTANDDLTYYDLDRVPATHREELETVTARLRESAARNAHERARRFGSAPLSLSVEGAKHHMEGRAEDLSQVRPEWGHATNALCIVGRRQKTRGLFLDRRAFLVSYDPTQDDDDATILSRILGAVVPVCSGINLEYYFSYVDSPGWGCGSKLPHNITGLLGVMDGAMSDLRTGLPWQMVEIHEPVRLLFVIEATPALLLRIMEKNRVIQTMVTRRWVQLAVMTPDRGEIMMYRDGEFHRHRSEIPPLPVAASSREWYAGWRDHLGFAEINPNPSDKR